MGTMARTALTAFAGLDAPERWPRPRSPPGRSYSARRWRRCPASARRCARRLCEARAAPQSEICSGSVRGATKSPSRRSGSAISSVTRRRCSECVIRSVTSRRRGRLKILTARVADETGEIKATWFNQPWLGRGSSSRARAVRSIGGFRGEEVRLRRSHPYGATATPRRATSPASTGDRGSRSQGRPLRSLRSRTLEPFEVVR